MFINDLSTKVVFGSIEISLRKGMEWSELVKQDTICVIFQQTKVWTEHSRRNESMIIQPWLRFNKPDTGQVNYFVLEEKRKEI